eukprot:1160119-Pelagomonas_calceolata.AAC.3
MLLLFESHAGRHEIVGALPVFVSLLPPLAQPEADRQGENHADMAVLEFSSGVTSSSPWILI